MIHRLWMESHGDPFADEKFSIFSQYVTKYGILFASFLRSDTEKKSQIESLKVEISSLKEQIDRQQQELRDKTAQVGKPEHSKANRSTEFKYIKCYFESNTFLASQM